MPNKERGHLYSDSSKKGDVSKRWKGLETYSGTWEISFHLNDPQFSPSRMETLVSIPEVPYENAGG